MTLDELLRQVRERQLILISEREVWPDPAVTQAIQRAMKRHQSGLKVLIRWSDIATCPAAGLHRREWYYKNGRFICGACERIKVA